MSAFLNDVRFTPKAAIERFVGMSAQGQKRTLRNKKDRNSGRTAAAFLYPFSRLADKKLVHSTYPPNKIRKHPTISTENRAPVCV